MATPKRGKKPTPFDVPMTDEQRTRLADELCRDVQSALEARASVIADGGTIDLADWYYEQGRSQDRPFVGAADLTSYIPYEKTSSLRARLMKAIFGVRPFCFVEGYGQDAKKAPFVEEFHDWQVRSNGLPLELYKTILGGLIEDCYILEVSEKVETRRIVEQFDAALEVNPETGGPIFADGQPKVQFDDQGEPVIAQPGPDGQLPASAKMERAYTKRKRLGPQYDAISMKDFVFLPGHAKSQKQVWGYAYRVWKRVPELQEQAKDGVYDADAVTALGEQSDRTGETLPKPVDTVAYQEGPSAEKELFQLSLKRDLDGDGREEWYIVTLCLRTRTILRLKLDTFTMKVGRPRCVPFVFFPRRNSVYGYSYIADALFTLAEEHTAIRNMKADRSALVNNAPLKVLQGALYDPEAQPFGVGRTITVREMNEVQPMVFPDVPQSAVEQTMEVNQAAERVGGLSDSAVGVLSAAHRTLGEQRLVAGGSAVRVDEIMGHLHAAIADVMYLSNAIWIETLEADGKGIDAPSGVIDALKARNQDLQDGKITAEQLKGNFKFEPYGSDETSDPERRLANFNNGFIALSNMAKSVPGLQAIFQNPGFGQWLLEGWMRAYDVRDRSPIQNAFTSQAGQLPPSAGAGPVSPMGGPPPAAGAPPAQPAGLPPPQVMAALTALHGGVPGQVGPGGVHG